MHAHPIVIDKLFTVLLIRYVHSPEPEEGDENELWLRSIAKQELASRKEPQLAANDTPDITGVHSSTDPRLAAYEVQAVERFFQSHRPKKKAISPWDHSMNKAVESIKEQSHSQTYSKASELDGFKDIQI